MKLEFPLLALLAGHHMSGYDIKKWTEVEGKFVGLDRHPSQIYRELGRMEVEGWIEHKTDPRDNAPDAKVYRLTSTGMTRLRRWMESAYVPPRQFHDPEFIFRLRTAAMLDLPRARALVEQELEARRAQVRANRGRPRPNDHVRQAAHPEVDTESLALVGDEANQHGEIAIDNWIAWLGSLLVRLDERLAARDAELDAELREELS